MESRFRRPICTISEALPCRFRLRGCCCHAGFEDSCPLPVERLAPFTCDEVTIWVEAPLCSEIVRTVLGERPSVTELLATSMK